jgi:hypothetical protein
MSRYRIKIKGEFEVSGIDEESALEELEDLLCPQVAELGLQVFDLKFKLLGSKKILKGVGSKLDTPKSRPTPIKVSPKNQTKEEFEKQRYEKFKELQKLIKKDAKVNPEKYDRT